MIDLIQSFFHIKDISSLTAARSVVCSLGEVASVSFFKGTSPKVSLYFLIGVALKLDSALIFLISSSSYLINFCSRLACSSA